MKQLFFLITAFTICLSSIQCTCSKKPQVKDENFNQETDAYVHEQLKSSDNLSENIKSLITRINNVPEQEASDIIDALSRHLKEEDILKNAALLISADQKNAKFKLAQLVFNVSKQSNNIDFAINNLDLNRQLLTELNSSDKFLPDVFMQSVFQGVFDLAKTIYEKNKEKIQSDVWLNYTSCILFLRTGDLTKSKQCLEKFESPWYTLTLLQIKKISGQNSEIDSAQVNKSIDEAMKMNVPDIIGMLYIYDYYLTNDLEGRDNDKIKSLAQDYQKGFMVLSLDKTRKKLPSTLKQEMESKYKSTFGESFLGKLYFNNQGLELLKERFGENSILVQSTR